NKAITGDNAFAHSSGIHQDGLLKSRDAYEIIDPNDVGLEDMELILTARSGRHAVKSTLRKLGFSGLSDEQFESIFNAFINLAEKKKEVYSHDLYMIVKNYFKEQDMEKSDIDLQAIDIKYHKDLQVISNTMFYSTR